jgi:hypothetical protein
MQIQAIAVGLQAALPVTERDVVSCAASMSSEAAVSYGLTGRGVDSKSAAEGLRYPF